MSCVSFFGTKSRGTFFCMPDDSSVLDEKSEYLGLNRRDYRIESAQVKFKTLTQRAAKQLSNSQRAAKQLSQKRAANRRAGGAAMQHSQHR